MTSSQTDDRPERAGLGAALRAARIASKLSLTDLERRTKIRSAHLSALEEERLDLLPPGPFARGFVQRYAQEVGLDPEPLLARLAEMVAAPTRPPGEPFRPVQAPIEPAQTPSRLRQRTSVVGVVALLAGVALVLFFVLQLFELGRPVPPSAEAPETVPSPAPAVTPAPVVTPVPAASPAPATSPGLGEGITVEITATGRSWLLVVADGQSLFEGFINPGESLRWQSAGSVTIRVGNAGVVVVTVNGKLVGPLGGRGEVVSRTFRKDAPP